MACFDAESARCGLPAALVLGAAGGGGVGSWKNAEGEGESAIKIRNQHSTLEPIVGT